MTSEPSSHLRMPAFLYGTFMFVARKASREGQRWGEQYRKDGLFPAPRELLDVPPGELVIAHEVADFERERPAWRLYLVSRVMSDVFKVLDYQNTRQVRDGFEAFCRGTAWGALHFAIEPTSPVSASQTALRLRAVGQFWEPLQSVRYLFKRLNAHLTLEELMVASNDWALDAWCALDEGSVRSRLELAAERMARATKGESIEAILREMPRAFTAARGLKHPSTLADPAFLRERLERLSPEAFADVSGACTSDLLGQLYTWERELEKQ